MLVQFTEEWLADYAASNPQVCLTTGADRASAITSDAGAMFIRSRIMNQIASCEMSLSLLGATPAGK